MRQTDKMMRGRLDPQQDQDANPGRVETEMSEVNARSSQSRRQDDRKHSA